MANKASTTTTTGDALLPRIEGRIQVLRGLRVMIDADLAALYGVDTRTLNQAVKRNAARFPPDFMFQLEQVFDAIRELMTPPDPPKRPIGFVTPEDKGKKTSGKK